MKTAMQQAIEHFKSINPKLINKFSGTQVAAILEGFKETEKQQIINSAHTMYMNGTTKYPITAEQYYSQTYKQ